MTQRLSFAQLEQAALHIIRLIADIPGLENTRLAIIGDLAVNKYLSRRDRVTVSHFTLS
jgi:hypothetical protein